MSIAILNTELYTYEQLVELPNEYLDIIVARFHGWFAAQSNYNPDQFQFFTPKSKEDEEPLVMYECPFELAAWMKAHEYMMKPATDGHAALILLDEMVSAPAGYQIEVEKDVSTVTPYGWGFNARSIVLGKPSESLPRAITISWIFMKQMQMIPFKKGDALLHDNRTLYFENIDPDDPTVAWATDEDGEEYELKTSELVKA